MGRQGVVVYSRPLRYRNRTVALPNGTQHSFLTGEEEGIDVRIALDVIALAHRRAHDVALVLSQDQDLSEVAEEIPTIAREQRRWIKIASAFPHSPASRNRRGINKTDWIRIDRKLYGRCLDHRDYRKRLEGLKGRHRATVHRAAGDSAVANADRITRCVSIARCPALSDPPRRGRQPRRPVPSASPSRVRPIDSGAADDLRGNHRTHPGARGSAREHGLPAVDPSARSSGSSGKRWSTGQSGDPGFHRCLPRPSGACAPPRLALVGQDRDAEIGGMVPVLGQLASRWDPRRTLLNSAGGAGVPTVRSLSAQLLASTGGAPEATPDGG